MSKLPKQWRHWCADQKLKIHGYKKGQRQWQWFCLKGKGYVWRVNCYGMLQRGDSMRCGCIGLQSRLALGAIH